MKRCNQCVTCVRLNRLRRLTDGRPLNAAITRSLMMAESSPCLQALGVARKQEGGVAASMSAAETVKPVGVPPKPGHRTMKAVLGKRKLRLYDVRVPIRF